MAHFARERIPERVVHVKGSGADGSFVCTKADMLPYTTVKLSSAAGKRMPILLRFSTVDSEKGFADSTKVRRLHSHLEA
jgi:catalase